MWIFLESTLLTFLFFVRQTWMTQLILGNFSVRVYLLLIWRGSITHMHGLAVYVKEGLPFAWDLSLEDSVDSYICFQLALFHWMSFFFLPYQSPSLSLCTVFDTISCNIWSTHLLISLPLETLTSIIRTNWCYVVQNKTFCDF